ncbi:MAG: DUF2892 domain-containing protein [Rhodospirillaceae bacterium]
MITNIGTIDRIVRVVAGVVLLSLLFFLEGASRWFGLVGVVLVLTGAFSFCPAYRLIGLSTCGNKDGGGCGSGGCGCS